MTNRNGVLARSPLKYVLASVRFAPWPLVAKKMDEIQNELRDSLPLMHHIRVESPEGQAQAAGQSQDAWMLADADKDYCVQISKDQIIFFTNSYINYKEFSKKNSRALNVLYKFMGFIDVHNVGVRYIDQIKPQAGEKRSDYISNKLLPPELQGFTNSGGHIISEYSSENYKLRVNVLGVPGAFPIPQEILSLPLVLNGPEKPFHVETLGEQEFIVDMDAISMYAPPKRLEQKALEEVVNELHNVANKFFRHSEVFTDHAFNIWKGES